MKLFADLEKIVKYDEPLAKHTWFKLGGAARYFVVPRNEAELEAVVNRGHEYAVGV